MRKVAARSCPTSAASAGIIPSVGAERIDERRRDDHARGPGPRDRPHMGRLRDAEPDGHGHGRHGRHLPDELRDGRRQRAPGAGHADQRHAVEEAAAPRRHGSPPGRRRTSGRRDRRPRCLPPPPPPRTARPRRASGPPRSPRPRRQPRARGPGRGRRRRRSAGWRSPWRRPARPAGRRRSARPARGSGRTSRPAASAPCDARWSVAPSASGSEYGSPTSSRSAPASIAAQAAGE